MTILSIMLGQYSDLVVVSTLLVVDATVSLLQERRAAGVVETLRRRLQVSVRVRRDSGWQVVMARELVPGPCQPENSSQAGPPQAGTA